MEVNRDTSNGKIKKTLNIAIIGGGLVGLTFEMFIVYSVSVYVWEFNYQFLCCLLYITYLLRFLYPCRSL